MSACGEYDVLLSLHAANALRGDERARVEAHLASCETCRDEFEASAEVLRLARLPLPGPVERRVLADLPERAVAAVRQGERRRGVVRRLALAMGAVAALSLVPLLPFVKGDRRPGVTELPRAEVALQAAHETPAPAALPAQESQQLELAEASPAIAVEAATWEEPDPDELWEHSSVLQSLALGEEMAFAAEAAVQ
jgi:predicted anti-sigma-YlaC factor YlaD